MKKISDELLVEAYIKAWLLEMDNEFIELLELEIKKRGIKIEDKLINEKSRFNL